MATTTLIRHREEEVQECVIKLQTKAKSEFEKQAREIKEEVEEMNEDQVEDYVHHKFQNLNAMFLENSRIVEELVLSKRPKKPVRHAGLISEEYQRMWDAYQEELKNYKKFVTWSMNLVNRLMTWLSELFSDVIAFVKNLWTWIKSKIHNISENVREFVEMVASKFNQLYNYLFEQ
ncbi:17396_t:CDS:2 [Acaulospora morrowiae]|uniref:17396_t:CDS:1 n=1 Tax=Acaulospora morrowiae TaxID=94023 RepID=A0A9N9H6B5_9GLOM|nr:17396_t:CDS:2 [Acaulospora morrowiae]